MTVPLLDLTDQHAALMPQFRQVFESAIASGAFILGPVVDQFESQLAAYCGTRHAVGLSSGTDALIAAMMAMGIGPGDEVITSTFSFFATAGAIARVGATPIFVDIDAVTFNIDPAHVEAAIGPRTAAIMPVHLYGLSADMDAMLALAQRHNLAVIEDAAQAIGATWRDKAAGAIGDVGCLSFFPTKNLGAMGDAGACVTQDDELAHKLRKVRVHGSGTTYHHETVGGNFRIDALQAGLLSVKLPHLDGWIDARRAHAERYATALADQSWLTLPSEPPPARHTYNQYTLRIADGRRDELLSHLGRKGIGCRVYYPLPLHLQPCFAHLGGQTGDHPVAERLAQEVLSLPVFPELTEPQQSEVIDAIRSFGSGEA